ncbi:hypothetical protein ACFSQ7_46020 [Paenibacillus rhizoplanae]
MKSISAPDFSKRRLDEPMRSISAPDFSKKQAEEAKVSPPLPKFLEFPPLASRESKNPRRLDPIIP